MSGINWGLANQNGFYNALAVGRQMGADIAEARDRKEYRGALAVLAQDPENPDALSRVFQHDPRVGVSLMDRADEKAFGRDAAAMMVPNGAPNALLGLGSGAPPQTGPQVNALAPMVAGASGGSPAEQSSLVATPDQRAESAQVERRLGVEGVTVQDDTRPEVDLSSLGQPRTEADQAFLRMVQRDPSKALKIRSELRDNFVAQMEAESDFYGLAMGELSRATNPQSWSQAVQALSVRGQALGMDISRVVPAEYPGPDAVADLMRRAQPIKEQLDLMVREANIDADNARADRNTDSMIETRERRAAEYERNNRERRNLTRRGQDMTDARVRSRGKSARPTATGPNGEKVEFDGKKWVPAK